MLRIPLERTPPLSRNVRMRSTRSEETTCVWSNRKQRKPSFRENISYPPAAYQLAKLLHRTDRSEEALPIIESNLKDLPQSLFLNFIKYRVAEALGNSEKMFEAADDLERSEYVVPMTLSTNYAEDIHERHGFARKASEYGQLIEGGEFGLLPDQLEEMVKLVGDLRVPERELWWASVGEVELQTAEPPRRFWLPLRSRKNLAS